MKTLYHTSNIVVDHPDIALSRNYLDFGRGFVCFGSQQYMDKRLHFVESIELDGYLADSLTIVYKSNQQSRPMEGTWLARPGDCS